MITARASANQSLYLAKILLDSWRAALEAGAVPALTLQQAFLPAVQAHLGHAYSWFLLEITDQEIPPDSDPPASTAGLSPIAEGKALPGELREFGQLEKSGWLADMLAAPPKFSSPSPRSRGNLASPAPSAGDYADALEWSTQLDQMMSRMRDSLDEC